jgi:hypothetical protein
VGCAAVGLSASSSGPLPGQRDWRLTVERSSKQPFARVAAQAMASVSRHSTCVLNRFLDLLADSLWHSVYPSQMVDAGSSHTAVSFWAWPDCGWETHQRVLCSDVLHGSRELSWTEGLGHVALTAALGEEASFE